MAGAMLVMRAMSTHARHLPGGHLKRQSKPLAVAA